MCHFSPSNCTLGVCGGKFLYNDLRGNKLASFHAFIGYDVTKRVMLLLYLPLSEIPVTHTFATSDNKLEICLQFSWVSEQKITTPKLSRRFSDT